ncbi:MAG: transposase, partial [Planctomycetota bacterium]
YEKRITRFTADVAYDQSAIYETFTVLGATVVVPPVKTATSSRRKTRAARARNRTVGRIRKVGRRQWKKEAKYHRQARAENTFFRFKQLLGGRLRSRDRVSQEVDARLGCKILNRMLQLGAPESESIRS